MIFLQHRQGKWLRSAAAPVLFYRTNMSETAQALSLERKIKMHEAREAIIDRLAMDLPTAINLDRFLNVIVSELGRMMNVARRGQLNHIATIDVHHAAQLRHD